MASPRADASRAQRSTDAGLMSVAVTVKPACARPMACVPMPQDASSTAPDVRPTSCSRPAMMPASQAIAASQSVKMRW
jgi:hypothetical protein